MDDSEDVPLLGSVARDDDKHSYVTGDSHSDGNIGKKPEFRSKLRESLIIIIAYSSQGLAGALTGPTLQDLQIITNSSIEKISLVMTGEFIGFVIGSLAATYAYMKIRYNLVFCLCLIICAATMAAIPWCPDVGIMSAVFALRGISGGLLITGLHFALILMWGTENKPYMQALHFSFALGSFAGPLLAAPFLSLTVKQHVSNSSDVKITDIIQNLSSNTITTMRNMTGETETMTKQSRVYIVYTIIAGWSFVWAVMFLIQAVRSGKSTVSPKQRDETAIHLPVEDHTSHFYINRIGIVAYGFLHASVFNSFVNYLSSFVMQYLNWTSSMGALLTSIYWASVCFGRVIPVLTAKCFSPTITIISCLVLSSVVLIFFTLLNQMESWIIWASVAFIGIGLGPITAATLSWYVQETSSLTSIISGAIGASAGLGSALSPLLLGYLFDNVTPMWFCYLLTGENILTLVLFAFLVVANNILRKRFCAYSSSLSGKVYK